MNIDTTYTFRRARALLATLLVVFAAGCKPTATEAATSAKTATAKSSGSTSVMTDSVNYMHERATHYTLYDLSKNPPKAIGGAIVDRLGTGGEKGCCLNLPRTWKPGMMVRVEWGESDLKQTYPEKYSRDLEIPRYDQPADLYVVFYPPHDVEVVVSIGEPGHPDWRGRIKATPWEQCVQTYGRKPCFAALPKQFDTANSQGYCTHTKSKDFPIENFPDPEGLCDSAMRQCMKDFEDEPFCKGILWGDYKK